jgi:hypothetical protein
MSPVAPRHYDPTDGLLPQYAEDLTDEQRALLDWCVDQELARWLEQHPD